MKIATIIPAAPDYKYRCAIEKWDFDIIAWGFEVGSGTPIPILLDGPRRRKGDKIITPEGSWSDL